MFEQIYREILWNKKWYFEECCFYQFVQQMLFDESNCVVKCFFFVGIYFFYMGYLDVCFFWNWFFGVGVVLIFIWVFGFLDYFFLMVKNEQVEVIWIDFLYGEFLGLVKFVIIWCKGIWGEENDF